MCMLFVEIFQMSAKTCSLAPASEVTKSSSVSCNVKKEQQDPGFRCKCKKSRQVVHTMIARTMVMKGPITMAKVLKSLSTEYAV